MTLIHYHMGLFFSFLLLFSFTISAQNPEPILTEEQNVVWIAELEKQELSEKLEMIQKRWKEDLNVYFEFSTPPHGMKNVQEEEARKSYKYESSCRPLYLFSIEGETVILPSNPSKEIIAKLSKVLNLKNIPEVQVKTGVNGQALYGTRASCGVIFLKVLEKDIFDRITSEVRTKK